MGILALESVGFQVSHILVLIGRIIIEIDLNYQFLSPCYVLYSFSTLVSLLYSFYLTVLTDKLTDD